MKETARKREEYVVANSACTAREDQVARRIPAKRGTIALSKHWVPKGQADGWRRRACVNS